ncbi:MAG: leucyl aminopeptidase [Parvularculales bacterium]
MEISFTSLKIPTKGIVALIVAEGTRLGSFGRKVDAATGGAVSRALNASHFKGKSSETVDVLGASGGIGRVVVMGLSRPSVGERELENLGGKLVGRVENSGETKLNIAVEPVHGCQVSASRMAACIALGARLRAYRFNKYKSKKKGKDRSLCLEHVCLMTQSVVGASRAYEASEALTEGIYLARDLVNEPPNVLCPEEFAARALELRSVGVKVEVLNEEKMKKLGMNALLGVGQGSIRESKLVVMQWKGARQKTSQPIAFVGKGVCFDTGGISLKPPVGMEDMKGDMGGAACVTGLIHALARRRAKVNAVVIVGLVENMPGGNAQRPGDIVTSMSGKTIEILNTDAEGRLVLADALWYAQQRFKPKIVIDLATLTGAIMVALGQEYAGLFSNNDRLSERLITAGETVNEKVWRMPLHDSYDKMLKSSFADVKNIGGRYAGSITAAQFLQRFIDKTPWAHLDIAGTAMACPSSDINHSWGSGYGVRLLNQLVVRHYEK